MTNVARYTAARIAPLGAVGPEVATAAFFGFHRDRIARALPDAWARATPAEALAARADGVDAALRRLWGDRVVDSPEVAEAAELAWEAAAAADCAGRVLAAANQTLPRPAAPHLALWQATTTLREHRGEGHIAALVSRGVTPMASHLLKAGAGESDPELLRQGRRFDEDAWRDERARLRADGVLDGEGRLTPSGRTLHQEIEDATDRAARGPWQALGAEATDRLAALLRPLAAVVVETGTLPVPNAVGLVPAP